MEIIKDKKKFLKDEIWYLCNHKNHSLDIYPVKIFKNCIEYDENDDCISVYGKDGIILVRPNELFKNVNLQAARSG